MILLCLLLTVPASADEVRLKSGDVYRGIVREHGKKVIIETGDGRHTFDAASVASVTLGKTHLHEYYERASKCNTARAHFELARWAEEKGIRKVVRKHLQRTIELDPKHEFARRALGYSLHRGRWMMPEEIERAMGNIRFEGKWISREERDLILAERKARREVEDPREVVRWISAPSGYAYSPVPYLGYGSPYWGTRVYWPYYGTGAFSFAGSTGGGGVTHFSYAKGFPSSRTTGYGRRVP